MKMIKFFEQAEKYTAIIEEIKEANTKGQPVLVGNDLYREIRASVRYA